MDPFKFSFQIDPLKTIVHFIEILSSYSSKSTSNDRCKGFAWFYYTPNLNDFIIAEQVKQHFTLIPEDILICQFQYELAYNNCLFVTSAPKRLANFME